MTWTTEDVMGVVVKMVNPSDESTEVWRDRDSVYIIDRGDCIRLRRGTDTRWAVWQASETQVVGGDAATILSAALENVGKRWTYCTPAGRSDARPWGALRAAGRVDLATCGEYGDLPRDVLFPAAEAIHQGADPHTVSGVLDAVSSRRCTYPGARDAFREAVEISHARRGRRGVVQVDQD